MADSSIVNYFFKKGFWGVWQNYPKESWRDLTRKPGRSHVPVISETASEAPPCCNRLERLWADSWLALSLLAGSDFILFIILHSSHPLPAPRSFLIYIKKEDKRQILSSVPGGENKTTSTLLWKNLIKNFLQRFYMWVLSNRLSSSWEIMFVYCFRGEISTYQEVKRCWRRTIVCNPKMKIDSCLENKVNVYCNAKLSAQKFAFSF